jgi:hypothetical protein
VAKYTEHEVGYGAAVDPNMASDKQLAFIRSLGMDIRKAITKRQAGRIIDQLLNAVPPEEVARTNRLSDSWVPAMASAKQLGYLSYLGLPNGPITTGRQASLLIEAKKDPAKFVERFMADLGRAKGQEAITKLGNELVSVRGILPQTHFEKCVAEGKRIRATASAAPAGDWNEDHLSDPPPSPPSDDDWVPKDLP